MDFKHGILKSLQSLRWHDHFAAKKAIATIEKSASLEQYSQKFREHNWALGRLAITMVSQNGIFSVPSGIRLLRTFSHLC